MLELKTVLKALLTARILVQFVGQIVALDFIRRQRPDLLRPFRVPLYPVPVLLALAGWLYVCATSGRQFIGFGLLVLASGLAVHGLWRRSAPSAA